jgi:hypothetical protein
MPIFCKVGPSYPVLNIKAILSVARSGLLHHQKEHVPHYLYLPAEDHGDYEIYKHFNQTYDFIEQARKDTNVLVHCMAGVSRSVTIVMAYLLKKYKTSLSQVISMIQRKRKKVPLRTLRSTPIKASSNNSRSTLKRKDSSATSRAKEFHPSIHASLQRRTSECPQLRPSSGRSIFCQIRFKNWGSIPEKDRPGTLPRRQERKIPDKRKTSLLAWIIMSLISLKWNRQEPR